LGKITKWDDAAIKKLNPSVTLPSTGINVVRRSDGSGTTFNFTDYLSKVSPEWKTKVGVNAAVEWPVGVGAKGNDGVAGNVGQTKNSIGYVEYAFAKQNKLTHTDLINKDGKRRRSRASRLRLRMPIGPMRRAMSRSSRIRRASNPGRSRRPPSSSSMPIRVTKPPRQRR
jgi:hypothetical protein